MEYIEGAPLGEQFNSLKEKGLKFSEERIWKIFIQVINQSCSSGAMLDFCSVLAVGPCLLLHA